VYEEWYYKNVDRWEKKDVLRVLRALGGLAIILALALAKWKLGW